MRFRFIDAEKAHYPIRLLCRCLAVSRSGYYAWRRRAPSARVQQDARLRVEIAASHSASRRTYGSPRILRDLREEGHRISRKRVARLMRELGLEGRRKRRFRATTDSQHRFPVAPNVLMRDFDVDAPNTAWVTDITYLATLEGWLYLAVILDLFSRRVVGYAMSEQIDRALVLEALGKALVRRPGARDLIHHSDRGSQYASHDYRDALDQAGITCSMSRRGDCWDNAVAESFFGDRHRRSDWLDRFWATGLRPRGAPPSRAAALKQCFPGADPSGARRAQLGEGLRNPVSRRRQANVEAGVGDRRQGWRGRQGASSPPSASKTRP